MEQVYTVRVKWKPNPGLNYPSERSYSSSTVGGLALCHFVLAALSSILCSIGYSSHIWRGEFLGGVVLVSGATVSGVAGVLAWKRWYRDRYIRWFFITSLLSVASSLLSIVLTSIVLATPELDSADPSPVPDNSTQPEPELPDWTLSLNHSRVRRDLANVLHDYQIKKEIYVHILLSSIVEFVWSLMSVKISWKGVKNSYLLKKTNSVQRHDGVGHPAPPTDKNSPDIIRNLKKNSFDPRLSNYSNVVKELCKIQKTTGIAAEEMGKNLVSALYIASDEAEKGLPQQESNTEYRERMERFLQSSTAGTEPYDDRL